MYGHERLCIQEEDEQGEIDIGNEEDDDDDDEEGDEYEDEEEDGNPGTKALVGPIIEDDDEEDFEPNVEVRSSRGFSLYASLYSLNYLSNLYI